MKKSLFLGVLAASIVVSSASFANEYEGAIKAHIDAKAMAWAHKDNVVAAIKAQNAKHADLDETAIIALDNKWRDGDQDFINATLGNDLSTYLQGVVEEQGGLYTEVFVMDNKGLNVGQSAETSDYWQGDEGKFKKTYPMGAGAVFVDEVEFDDSTQSYQSQASFTIKDPASGDAIGAVTIGINVDDL